MAKKAKIVGGFDVYKAAQRAVEHGVQPHPSETPAAPSGKTPGAGKAKKPAARIGHTALPTRLDIACQSCGFEFQITGRAQNTACPKCKALIELADYTIDQDWNTSITTGGKIRITDTGVVHYGNLVATDIKLDGALRSGRLRAFRLLEIGPKAEYGEEEITCRDLRVAEGARVSFKKKRQFRNVEVHGELSGRIEATGLISVKAGGLLRGTIQGAHLEVEEGGGLRARLKIRIPEASEATTEPNEKLRKTA